VKEFVPIYSYVRVLKLQNYFKEFDGIWYWSSVVKERKKELNMT